MQWRSFEFGPEDWDLVPRDPPAGPSLGAPLVTESLEGGLLLRERDDDEAYLYSPATIELEESV